MVIAEPEMVGLIVMWRRRRQKVGRGPRPFDRPTQLLLQPLLTSQPPVQLYWTEHVRNAMYMDFSIL
jgi:hypothetical protein